MRPADRSRRRFRPNSAVNRTAPWCVRLHEAPGGAYAIRSEHAGPRKEGTHMNITAKWVGVALAAAGIALASPLAEAAGRGGGGGGHGGGHGGGYGGHSAAVHGGGGHYSGGH